MSNILERVAGMLTGLAEDVAALSPLLALPREEYSYVEGIAHLRAVLGKDCYIAVYPGSIHSHCGNGTLKVADWSVYDGKDHHKGRTFTAAVKAALAAHAPATCDPLAEMQALHDEAMAGPFEEPEAAAA